MRFPFWETDRRQNLPHSQRSSPCVRTVYIETVIGWISAKAETGETGSVAYFLNYVRINDI